MRKNNVKVHRVIIDSFDESIMTLLEKISLDSLPADGNEFMLILKIAFIFEEVMKLRIFQFPNMKAELIRTLSNIDWVKDGNKIRPYLKENKDDKYNGYTRLILDDKAFSFPINILGK